MVTKQNKACNGLSLLQCPWPWTEVCRKISQHRTPISDVLLAVKPRESLKSCNYKLDYSDRRAGRAPRVITKAVCKRCSPLCKAITRTILVIECTYACKFELLDIPIAFVK